MRVRVEDRILLKIEHPLIYQILFGRFGNYQNKKRVAQGLDAQFIL
jgi:hypothetical protein